MQPLLGTVRAEFGGNLPEASSISGQLGSELYGAFCGHGFRGQDVSADLVNGFSLGVGGFAMYLPGFALLVSHVSRIRTRSTARNLALAMIGIVAVQFVLIAGAWETINFVTYFWLD